MKERRTFRRAAADFWLGQVFWWAETWPSLYPFWEWLGCACAWRFSHFIRRGTVANARRILGPRASEREQNQLARRVIRNFFWFCGDMGQSLHATPEELAGRIEGIEGKEWYAQARAAKKGVIVGTAHMGSFEVAMAALRQMEEKVHVVFRRDAFSRFDRQRSELRRRLGVCEAALDEGWTVWIRLRDALLANEAVVLQGDRVLPGQKGWRATLLHGHVEMPAGPVKLALMTGAPIVPVFSIRLPGGKIRLFIEEAIWAEGDGEAALNRLAGVIGRYVATYPEQWLVLEPAWCEDRDGIITQDTPAGSG